VNVRRALYIIYGILWGRMAGHNILPRRHISVIYRLVVEVDADAEATPMPGDTVTAGQWSGAVVEASMWSALDMRMLQSKLYAAGWNNYSLGQHLGVEANTVGRWFRGESRPYRRNVDALQRLCSTLAAGAAEQL